MIRAFRIREEFEIRLCKIVSTSSRLLAILMNSVSSALCGDGIPRLELLEHFNISLVVSLVVVVQFSSLASGY